MTVAETVAAALIISGLIFGPFIISTFAFWYITKEALASVVFGLVCVVLEAFVLWMVKD